MAAIPMRRLDQDGREFIPRSRATPGLAPELPPKTGKRVGVDMATRMAKAADRYG